MSTALPAAAASAAAVSTALAMAAQGESSTGHEPRKQVESLSHSPLLPHAPACPVLQLLYVGVGGGLVLQHLFAVRRQPCLFPFLWPVTYNTIRFFLPLVVLPFVL